MLKSISGLFFAWSLLISVSAIAAPTVSTDKPSYSAGESIVIKFSGLPGNAKDWITLAEKGSSSFKFGVQRQYTEGNKSGELTFTPLPQGDYEVRLYFDYPRGGYTVRAKQAFSVGPGGASAAAEGEESGEPPAVPFEERPVPPGPYVETEKKVYTLNEPIRVKYSGAPGQHYDWLSISTKDFREDKQSNDWQYIRQPTGILTFDAANLYKAGDYEVRMYFYETQYKVEARYAFEITEPTVEVTTDKEEYTVGEPVVVSFKKFPNYKENWIGLIRSSRPDFEFGAKEHWKYLDGQASGELTFNNFKPGEYEARGYFVQSFFGNEVKARAKFVVKEEEDESEIEISLDDEEEEDEEEEDDDEDDEEEDEDDDEDYEDDEE